MSDDRKRAIREQIQSAVEAGVPLIYLNGLSTSLGAGDITCALFHQGRPVGILNMSYTMAKTMAAQLNWAIEVLEKKTGHEIMTSDYISKKLEQDENEEVGGED